MAWFLCYDNSDVIASLINMTNFHLLWWQFFLMFVYDDVVYAQTWHLPWKTVSSHLHTPVRPMLLKYGPRFFSTLLQKIWDTCENFLGKWFAAPPGKKFPVRLCLSVIELVGLNKIWSRGINFGRWAPKPGAVLKATNLQSRRPIKEGKSRSGSRIYNSNSIENATPCSGTSPIILFNLVSRALGTKLYPLVREYLPLAPT